MNQSKKSVRIDPDNRIAKYAGVVLPLQDQAWQVLSILISRAPSCVHRDDLIENIWHGNYTTGEKGLNQAIWAIRSALGDNSRAPRFVRTARGQGYQWVHMPAEPNQPVRRVKTWGTIAAGLAAGLAALTMVPGADSTNNSGLYAAPQRCLVPGDTETTAQLLDRDVVVDTTGGCRLIVKPSGNKKFGSPVVSDDGGHIAFTVTQENACRLVVVAIKSGIHQEFGVCRPSVG